MIRRVLCALVLAVIWIGVFGWVAGARWDTPWQPQQSVQLDANTFHVVMGAGVEDGTSLRVGAVGDGGNALQSATLASLNASDFSALRYRFEGFPRTLELSLIFRRADTPGDVQALTIPWPGGGWHALDLRKVPGWRGRIVELGFAEYATPQVVPESVAFTPFRFDAAQLWSPSWRGGLAALYTSWFGYTPWALISVSALGPQRETAQAPPLAPPLVLAGVLSVLAAALILRWRWQRSLRNAAIGAATLWVLLDLLWLHDFHAKHLLTEQLYAGNSWEARQQLVPDQDAAFAAVQVGNWLAAQPPTQRILVASDSNYTQLRLIYRLLPHNVALLQQAGAAPLPDGSLILLYASTQWHYDTQRGAVVGNSMAYPVEAVFDSAGAQVYRVHKAAP